MQIPQIQIPQEGVCAHPSLSDPLHSREIQELKQRNLLSLNQQQTPPCPCWKQTPGMEGTKQVRFIKKPGLTNTTDVTI